MTNRDTNLDFCKGVAIFLVVMGHVLQFVINDKGRMYDFIYTFHMPFFFMLSGYLAWKPKEFGLSFWTKKARTLLLPMFVVGGIFSLVYNEIGIFIMHGFHAGYWFLLSLFEVWLAFALMHCVTIKLHIKNVWLEVIILLLPFIVMKVLEGRVPQSVVDVLTLNLSSAHYRWFVLGYFLGSQKNFKDFLMKDSIQALSVTLFCCIMLIYFTGTSWIGRIPFSILQMVLCLTCYVLCSTVNNNISTKSAHFIQTCGSKSLQIYVFHYFFIYQFSMELSGISEGFKMLIAVGVTLVVLLLALSIGWLMERNRYLSCICLGRSI